MRLRPGRLLDGPLVTAMATTEQTLLDLADVPGLGGGDPRRVGEAGLAVRADWDEMRARAHFGAHSAVVRIFRSLVAQKACESKNKGHLKGPLTCCFIRGR